MSQGIVNLKDGILLFPPHPVKLQENNNKYCCFVTVGDVNSGP